MLLKIIKSHRILVENTLAEIKHPEGYVYVRTSGFDRHVKVCVAVYTSNYRVHADMGN